MAKRITNKVTWVGKVDWELVYFHGKEYSTDRLFLWILSGARTIENLSNG